MNVLLFEQSLLSASYFLRNSSGSPSARKCVMRYAPLSDTCSSDRILLTSPRSASMTCMSSVLSLLSRFGVPVTCLLYTSHVTHHFYLHLVIIFSRYRDLRIYFLLTFICQPFRFLPVIPFYENIAFTFTASPSSCSAASSCEFPFTPR